MAKRSTSPLVPIFITVFLGMPGVGIIIPVIPVLFFEANSDFFSPDVSLGETLCLFNSAGLMEIAINMGKAGSMLGLKLDDVVRVDFY